MADSAPDAAPSTPAVLTFSDASLPAMLYTFRSQGEHSTIKQARRRWHYITRGDDDAPPLLYAPSTLSMPELDFALIEQLAQHYRVLIPVVSHPRLTVADWVQAAHAVAQYETLGRYDDDGKRPLYTLADLSVVGVALGGAVAQYLARALPDGCRALVLSHTLLPAPERGPVARTRLGLLRLMPAPLLRWQTRTALQHSFRHDSPASTALRDGWLHYLSHEYDATFSRQALIDQTYIMADYHSQPPLKPLTAPLSQVPMLIIDSENDDVLDVGERGALRALYPQAHLQAMPQGGNTAPLLHGVALGRSIARFIASAGEA